MAYYRIGEGVGERIFAWGHLNSAENVSNGALLDFDGNGVLYVRLPCGHSRGNHAFWAGYYTTRGGDGNVQVYDGDNVQMRVFLWR